MAYYTADQAYYDAAADPQWSAQQAEFVVRPMGSSGGGGGVTEYVMNKVWDPFSGGQWVSWKTVGAADPTGASYPDPYGSGFGACSNFRVDGKRYL